MMGLKPDAKSVLDLILLLTKRVTYYQEPNGEVSLIKLTFKDGTSLTMDQITKHYKRIINK